MKQKVKPAPGLVACGLGSAHQRRWSKVAAVASRVSFGAVAVGVVTGLSKAGAEELVRGWPWW
jgi:hypothetical protein